MPMSPPVGGKAISGQVPPAKEANEHSLNPKKCIGTETGQLNYVQKLKTKYYGDHLTQMQRSIKSYMVE